MFCLCRYFGTHSFCRVGLIRLVTQWLLCSVSHQFALPVCSLPQRVCAGYLVSSQEVIFLCLSESLTFCQNSSERSCNGSSLFCVRWGTPLSGLTRVRHLCSRAYVLPGDGVSSLKNAEEIAPFEIQDETLNPNLFLSWVLIACNAFTL